MTLCVCSTNRGKLRELIFDGRESRIADLDIRPLPGLESIPSPPENGATFEENARSKAIYYSAFTRELTLADDSGLEVFALHGAPGVYSARYAGPNVKDATNNQLLLARLRDVPDRRARFVCVLSLARAGRVLTTLEGTVEGEIVASPRGDSGFGYDPLFFYPPLQRTFAELTPDEKFAVSHRGNAVRALFRYLEGAECNRLPRSDKIE